MKALIVIDMLEDFVHGSLANPKAEPILRPLPATAGTRAFRGVGGRLLERRPRAGGPGAVDLG